MMGICDASGHGVGNQRGGAVHEVSWGQRCSTAGERGRAMRYVFDTYVLDTQRYEFQHAGEPLKLRRKVFQVLAYLLEHRDRVVPKQELLEHLWPDQFVGDEVLKSCLKTLRQALGERGRTPHFVRTLHGQGYRFVAPVEERFDAPSLSASPSPPHTELLPPLHLPTGERRQVTVLCGTLAHTTTLAD